MKLLAKQNLNYLYEMALHDKGNHYIYIFFPFFLTCMYLRLFKYLTINF
jgi:hypothetical protein